MNQLLLDCGANVEGLRLIVNGDTVTASPAVSIPGGVYTHLAATYDNGAVTLYVNGTQVGSGTAGSGTPVIDFNDGHRIQVGEDWLWGAGHGEQYNGYMDDILIYDRALTSNEIARLSVASASEFFLRDGVLYTAEDDTVKATDKLAQSLAQDGVFSAGVTVSGDSPKFGASAFRFEKVSGSATVSLPDTKWLGQRFTLAAYVRTLTDSIQRLFSSYDGGSAGADEMVFDFDPDGSPGWSIRFYHQGVQTTANKPFNDGAYHHLAMTYNDGAVALYIDGECVGSGVNGSGPVMLAYDLRIGEDWGAAGSGGEQLVGFVDDALVLFEALTPAEVASLAQGGAASFFELPWKGTLISLR